MRALTTFATVICLAGCGERPIKISVSALRVDDGDEDLIDEAVAILGHTWEPSRATRGSVHLTLIDQQETDQFGGVAELSEARCFKSVTSVRNPFSVAHELGHVFGLEHVCDPKECDDPLPCRGLVKCGPEHESHLMNGAVALGGVELSEDEQQTVDHSVQRLDRCIGSRG